MQFKILGTRSWPEYFQNLLRITLVRYILLDLRSKTRQRATLLLLTRIYSCRLRGIVNFTFIYDKHDDFNFHIINFPFLGSNIPTSPTHDVLTHSLYDMHRLAPHMDVLLWRQRDFAISFSCTDHSLSGAFWLTRRLGLYDWALSKPLQRRQGPDPRPLWLLVGTSSAFGP